MTLRLVDRLVREGKYAQAMRALEKARSTQPKNPYINAYEERIRSLLQAQQDASRGMHDFSIWGEYENPLEVRSLAADMPSVEGQMNAIAIPMRPPQPAQETTSQKPPRQEPTLPQPPQPEMPEPPAPARAEDKRIAILAKVASLLGQANEYLAQNEYERALEEIWRASLLDPENKDILELEERVKGARAEALELETETQERATREREHEAERRLQEEMEHVRREQEEKGRQEEESRRAAQRQKLQSCLDKCRALIHERRLKEARTEVSFALVIDPENPEAVTLQHTIIAQEEEIRLAELRRQQEEEERCEREATMAQIREAIAAARAAAERQDFNEALRALTTAYVLDPGNEELQACESAILSEREEWKRRQEEERRRHERELQRQREREQQRREDEERTRLLAAKQAEAEARKNAIREQVEAHLSRAVDFLADDLFEKALAEVALAFMADPLNEEIKSIEQMALQAQEEARSIQADTDRSADPERIPDPETSARIALMLEAADRFASECDFSRAFDEIARGYALDPRNAAVEECEERVQAEFLRFLEKKGSLPATLEASGAEPFPRAEPVSSATTEGARPGYGGLHRINDHMPVPSPGRVRRRKRITYALVAAAVLTVVYLRASSDSAAPADAAPEPAQTASLTLPSGNPSIQPAVGSSNGSTSDGTRPKERAAASDPVKRQAVTPLETPPSSEGSRASILQGQPASDAATRQAVRETTALSLPAPQQNNPPPEVVPSRIDNVQPTLKTELAAGAPPKVDMLTRPPGVVRLEKPKLPAAALNTGASGEVTVRVEISSDGKPAGAAIIKSTNSLFDEAVIDAVMHSEYSPGVSASGPTTAWITIPFRFKQ